MYHVNACAGDGSAICLDGADRRRLVSIIGIATARFRWECHAYCALGTHYHLFITTPEPNLAAGMRWLNGVYGLTFNRRYRRSGHVFGGRYHDTLVQDEDHARRVFRYIALNPVEARLCACPARWPWSSYNPTIGCAPVPAFLSLELFAELFGPGLDGARAAFQSFVAESLPIPTAA